MATCLLTISSTTGLCKKQPPRGQPRSGFVLRNKKPPCGSFRAVFCNVYQSSKILSQFAFLKYFVLLLYHKTAYLSRKKDRYGSDVTVFFGIRIQGKMNTLNISARLLYHNQCVLSSIILNSFRRYPSLKLIKVIPSALIILDR